MPPIDVRASSLPTRYPTTLIDARWLGGAHRLLLRPVLPQDDHLLSDLMQAQSAGARRNRFHGAVKPSPRLCQQMSQLDYRRQLALVVCAVVDGVEQLVADARYGLVPDAHGSDDQCAEFALMVDERWQRLGVGGWALRALQQAAAAAGLVWLQGDVLHDNQAMLGLAQRCGFACSPDPLDERLVRVQHHLAAGGANPARAAPERPPGLLQRLGRALIGPPATQLHLQPQGQPRAGS